MRTGEASGGAEHGVATLGLQLEHLDTVSDVGQRQGPYAGAPGVRAGRAARRAPFMQAVLRAELARSETVARAVERLGLASEDEFERGAQLAVDEVAMTAMENDVAALRKELAARDAECAELRAEVARLKDIITLH